ncbi:hypothetical protein BUE80_DR012001 [Diplocarpon rosae]|nr:hypothetical protein BUE80_DR012001 [Diplocarpon rosae]
MKYSIFALAFAVLCSAELYCDNGYNDDAVGCGNKSLYCCFNMGGPWGPWSNARKGCGDPYAGEKPICATNGPEYTAYGYCCDS